MRLKVAPLLSSGMVLQQGVSVPIQGKAPPDAEITVSFRGTLYQAGAEKDGAWRMFLDSQAAGGPYTMEISMETPADAAKNSRETEKIAIHDIYVGDVWICSGQSNMELPMQRLKDDFPEEWEPPLNSLIRQFKVPQEWDFSGPRQELSGGCWTAASPETLGEFSGTAWFFARALYEKHPVPIGLITAAWGGTPAEAWMSRDALAAFPEKIAMGEQYADPAKRAAIMEETSGVIEEWEKNLAREDMGLPQDWKNPQTDIVGWDDITLPGDFAAATTATTAATTATAAATAGLEDFCGVLWLAKDFEASASLAARTAKIWLGTIVDADSVYINGVEAGSTGYRYPPRKYAIPAALLHEGKNRVVLRVICNNGDGGVTRGKPFRIFAGGETVELAGTWKYKTGAVATRRPQEFFFQRQPMGNYNAMIAPILGSPCKGVIWYQGESNDSNPHEYAALFTALINDWRDTVKRFQQDAPRPPDAPRQPETPHPPDAQRPPGAPHPPEAPLPFLFVQLPIFGPPEDDTESSPWAIIRDAQRSALSLPQTGMAAGLDLGEWNDLHPLNKKDIGRRLALAADKVVFKNPNSSPGPLLRGVELRGAKLIFTFDNCAAGLRKNEARKNEAELKPIPDTALISDYISIVAEDGVFRLPASIEGPACLSVDVSAVKNPLKALYAWANNPRSRNWYNSDGLPMIPFQAAVKTT